MTPDDIIRMPLTDDDDMVPCAVCHGAGVFACPDGCHTSECPNDCEEGYVPAGMNP